MVKSGAPSQIEDRRQHAEWSRKGDRIVITVASRVSGQLDTILELPESEEPLVTLMLNDEHEEFERVLCLRPPNRKPCWQSLAAACHFCAPRCVKLLIDMGARPGGAATGDGKGPLNYALGQFISTRNSSSRRDAAKRCARSVLDVLPADELNEACGRDLLEFCCSATLNGSSEYDALPALELLLASKADPNVGLAVAGVQKNGNGNGNGTDGGRILPLVMCARATPSRPLTLLPPSARAVVSPKLLPTRVLAPRPPLRARRSNASVGVVEALLKHGANPAPAMPELQQGEHLSSQHRCNRTRELITGARYHRRAELPKVGPLAECSRRGGSIESLAEVSRTPALGRELEALGYRTDAEKRALTAEIEAFAKCNPSYDICEEEYEKIDDAAERGRFERIEPSTEALLVDAMLTRFEATKRVRLRDATTDAALSGRQGTVLKDWPGLSKRAVLLSGDKEPLVVPKDRLIFIDDASEPGNGGGGGMPVTGQGDALAQEARSDASGARPASRKQNGGIVRTLFAGGMAMFGTAASKSNETGSGADTGAGDPEVNDMDLSMAICLGDVKTLKGRLESGLSPDALDSQGEALVQLAIMTSNDGCLKTLLEAKASVNKLNCNDGGRPATPDRS